MAPPNYTKQDLENAAEFLKTLEDVKKALKDNAALTQEQKQALTDAGIVAADINDKLNEQRQLHQMIRDVRREQSADILEQKALLEAQASILEQHQSTFSDMVDLAETNKELAEAQVSYLEDQYKKGKLSADQYLDQVKTAREDLGIAQERVDTLNEQADAGARVGAQLANVLGISRDATPSFAQNLVLMMHQKDSMKALYNELGGVSGIIGSIGNKGVEIFTALIGTAIKLAIATRDLGINLRRSTGMTQALASEAQALDRRFKNLAFTSEQTQEAFSSLFTTVSEFSMATPATRDRMVSLSMAASRAGISFNDFASATQVSSRVMGLSGAAAAENAAKMGHFAAQIGLVPSVVVGAMSSVVPAIAAMGKGVGKEMRELARINKATGIEMQRLIAIGDQFDTFEGSAKAVGSLNAMLGGDFVNAIDLMMAKSPSERFMMLKDSLDAAGKSFDTMTYYERKAIAGALGFSNVGELAMMMKGNFDALSGTATMGTAEWEKYYEQQQQLKTIKEELTSVVARLAPDFIKFIEHFERFVDYVQTPGFEEDAKKIIGIMIALKGASIGLAMAQMAASLGSKKMTLTFGLLALALGAVAYILFEKTYASNFLQGLGKFALAIFGLGRASDASAPSISRMVGPLLGMGGAALMMGGAIALAALGVAELVTSFEGLGPAAGPAATAVVGLVVGFGLLVGALAAVAIFAAPAAPVLLAIGAAVGLIGLGIGLAAAGMSLFVNALATMFTKVKPADLALGIGAMAAALPALTGAAALAIVPIGGLAGAFVGLAAGIEALTASLGKLERLEGFPNLQAAIVNRVMAVTVGAGEATGRAVAAAVPTPTAAAASNGGPVNLTVQLDRQGTLDFLGGKPITREGLANRVFRGLSPD